MSEIFQQTPSMISTDTGFFDILKPETYPFPIEEIAHALSNICRYTGHVSRFYSVAEHCVLVSRLAPKRYALESLLHDAAEAYLGDVSAPLKRLLPDYKAIELDVEKAIANRYNLSFPFDPRVKKADAEAYWAERATIAKPPAGAEDTLWLQEYKEPKLKPIGLSPTSAEREFLERYWEILNETATVKASTCAKAA